MKNGYLIFLTIIQLTNPTIIHAQAAKTNKIKRMISSGEAIKIATDKVMEITKNDKEVVLWKEKSIVKPYGWYFVFTTAKYVQTRNPHDLKFGVPFIYVSKEGELEIIPTSVPLESFIKNKEETLQKKQNP